MDPLEIHVGQGDGRVRNQANFLLETHDGTSDPVLTNALSGLAVEAQLVSDKADLLPPSRVKELGETDFQSHFNDFINLVVVVADRNPGGILLASGPEPWGSSRACGRNFIVASREDVTDDGILYDLVKPTSLTLDIARVEENRHLQVCHGVVDVVMVLSMLHKVVKGTGPAGDQ